MQPQTPPVYEFPCPEKTGWDRYFPEGQGYNLPEGHGDVTLTFERFIKPKAAKETESDKTATCTLPRYP